MISIYTILVSCNPFDNIKDNKITWATVAKLPVLAGMQKQLGVAGVFTGVSNDVLLIAGGSNFADGAKPWQGGKKLHKNDIYVLKKEAENMFTWLNPQPAHLKQKVAYGASVTLPEGVVCAGGETDEANSSREVFMMNWDAQKAKYYLKKCLPCRFRWQMRGWLISAKRFTLLEVKAMENLPPNPSCLIYQLRIRNGNLCQTCQLPCRTRLPLPNQMAKMNAFM